MAVWKARMGELREFRELEGGAFSEDATQARRKAAMQRDFQSFEPRVVERFQLPVGHPLRPCANHVGQAFGLTGWDKTKVIGCCYLCNWDGYHTAFAMGFDRKLKQ